MLPNKRFVADALPNTLTIKVCQIDLLHLKKPTNTKEYSQLEKILDKFIDEVRDDGKHPLAIAMQIIGDNLEQYDNEQQQSLGAHVTDIEFIKHLMKSYHLNQSDLAEIFGGQGNVSKFLNGERGL